MERKRIKVVLAMYDASIMQQCMRVLKPMTEIIVLSAVTDGEVAYRRIQRLHPDIVIAQVLMPHIDGCTLMEILEEKMGDAMPDFMLCYSFMPEVLRSLTQNEHVIQCHGFPVKDKILHKQFKMGFAYYYKRQQWADYRKMYLGNQYVKEKEYEYTAESIEEIPLPKRVEQMITYELRMAGVCETYKGYRYIHEILTHWLLDEEWLRYGMIECYQCLADQYGVHYKSVEHSIRNCIGKLWEDGNQEYLQSIFHCTQLTKQNIPHSGVFLKRMLTVLKQEYIW